MRIPWQNVLQWALLWLPVVAKPEYNFPPAKNELGSESQHWTTTEIDPDSWRLIFTYRGTLDVDLNGEATDSNRLEQRQSELLFGILGGKGQYLDNYLRLDTKAIDPSMRALANAMRDISTSEVFLRQKIYAWMENKVNSFNANDYRSYISTAYYSLGMPGVEYDYTSLKRQGLADEIFNPRQDPMQIEHFLEVHFAGPILVAAINAGIVQGDETLLTTLSLLRLIFNHQANLAWAPPELNRLKLTFFNGNKIKLDRQGEALLMYLDAMSRQFGPFIKRVINHAEFTQSHTLLITALKVIQQSPFCENNWKDVVYHNSITGEILLYAEKDQLGFPWSSFDVKNKVASWRKYGLVHNEVYFNFVLNGDLNNKDFCNDMSVLKVKDSTWYIPKFYESLGDIFSVCLCILEKRSNSLLTWGINLKKMRATNYINELVVKELQEMLEKNVFEELGKFEQSDYQDIPLRQLFLVDRMLDSDLIIENIQYFKNLRAQLIGIMSDSLLKNLKDSAKYLRQWATDGRMTSKRSTELLWYIKSMIKDSMIKDSMNLILRQEACNVIAHWLHEEILDRNDLELDTDEQLPQLCPNLY